MLKSLFVEFIPAGLGANRRSVQEKLRDGALSVKDFGAKGDGVTDDRAAINAAMLAASNLATSNGQRVTVYLPAGIYRCNNYLAAQSNTRIVNDGHLRFHGGPAVGHFFLVDSKQNIEITGGLWDSNDQQNDNCIAVGFLDSLPVSENIWIHDLTIKNAKHGGTHIADITNPASVGTGGGKGITIQHGVKNVMVHDVIIDDCDIGFSIEGKVGLTGYCNGVVMDNIIVKNAKYIGAFLWGSYQEPITGAVMSAEIRNIFFVNCCNGINDFDAANISRDFGVITTNGGGHWNLSGRVLNEDGSTELLRGSHRFCSLNLEADVYKLSNVINPVKYGGYNGLEAASLYNRRRINVQTGDTVSGYLNCGDAGFPSLKNFDHFDFLCFAGTIDGNAWQGADLFANLDETNQWEVFNRGKGEVYRGQGTEAYTKTPGAQSHLFGLTVQDDSVNGLTALRSARNIAIRDTAGSSQMVVETGLLKVNNKLGFGSSTRALTWGAGSPEGVVSAPIGALYLNTSGGAGTTIYVKESGAGNTGWIGK